MDRAPKPQIKIGEWLVDPTAGQIARGAEIERVEARTMRLLVYLAERPEQRAAARDCPEETGSESPKSAATHTAIASGFILELKVAIANHTTTTVKSNGPSHPMRIFQLSFFAIHRSQSGATSGDGKRVRDSLTGGRGKPEL